MPHPPPSACRPSAGGREAVPARRLEHPLITAQVWSYTHSCVQHSSVNPFCLTRREQVPYVYEVIQGCVILGKLSSLQHAVRKISAIFHHCKPLCVVSQLRRPIYNSTVEEWRGHHTNYFRRPRSSVPTAATASSFSRHSPRSMILTVAYHSQAFAYDHATIAQRCEMTHVGMSL